jgi:hypothetical protein
MWPIQLAFPLHISCRIKAPNFHKTIQVQKCTDNSYTDRTLARVSDNQYLTAGSRFLAKPISISLVMKTPPFYNYGVHKNLDPMLNTFDTDSGMLIPATYKQIFQVVSCLHVFRKFLCNKHDLQFQILFIHPSNYSMMKPKIIKFRYEYDVIIKGIS